jgi:hypothetical protein
MSAKKFRAITFPIIAVLLVLVIAANVAAVMFDSFLDHYLGVNPYDIITITGSENWDTNYYTGKYSPKEAALRVATADVTLDMSTKFSFAWPAGVKGPRVAHVAVAPEGADADDPDMRFKLLGTAAFYRRYRQGTLAPDGAWKPYHCPDENLWERLFPPAEPVDYGWIRTAEAFRLVTEGGRPDVKTTLPDES